MQSYFNAAAYARASKDDADSSTIENQLDLIKGYAKSTQDIKIVSERSDNGFSGIDFLRPSFTEMIKDAEEGKINCIIVKDLSRLGRNYIEVGELMKDILPKLKVRLISVNDRYDSSTPKNDSDDIIIPFKNLLNEQYLRDISIKIRSNLNVKRKNGDFVAPHVPYGYMRDESNKHRLVIDERAAKIVRDIFSLKLQGMSQQKIADRLNDIGEPAPLEYKRKQGINFSTSFQRNDRALWSAVAVKRILSNPVYVGTLVQGKETTPNYKVKKRIMKPDDEWNIIENTHESIIRKTDFETVSGLLHQDTRTPPKQDIVFPLSGMMFCGDCGNNIVRKKVGKYYYYVCATNKTGKGCTSHSFAANELETAIMETIAQQIATILDLEKCLDYIKNLPYQQLNMQKINEQIIDREKEIKDCERYKRSLYEDYKNGELSKEDFIAFGKDYTDRIDELTQATKILKQESELLFNENNAINKWIEHFKRYKNVSDLSRQLAVSLIKRVDVFEKKQITVVFRYQDKFETIQKLLQDLKMGD
ncbi:MAG: recombinase family protein [Oscillospiraceae bacterium]|nr:recombinase family protein [Oscillospiraceae bacterium]